jgi:peptidylprolyl isomerase
VIELAASVAPLHAANIKALARARYFDGAGVVRVQDNYVVQWGDPADDEKHEPRRPIRAAQPTLKAEFTRALVGLRFAPLPEPDDYAPEVGFSDGFPAARDPASGRAWLTHCYGMVGAGRDTDADSGGGAELYAVIGHAPRQLDRNVTLIGRVVWGIELLSALPRGPAPMGFYLHTAERTPIRAVRLAADVPDAERAHLEVLRTDTATFRALVESRKNRREPWFKSPAGHIDLCNVPLPVRRKP